MLRLGSSCCVYWPGFIVKRVSHIVNSVFLLVFRTLHVTVCGVSAVLSVNVANNGVQNRHSSSLFAAYG